MERFSRLYVANTEFELELMQDKPMRPFLFHHPISVQLQCLPFLFALPDDGIVIKGQLVPEYFEHLCSLGLPDFSKNVVSPDEDVECDSVSSWGMSLGVAEWARGKGLLYDMPSWDVVRKVNSKLFSFDQMPGFEGSRLIENEGALRAWLKELSGRGVLKTCFGFSGKGKVIVDDSLPLERLLPFCKKEWNRGHPLIAESWLNKELDFSSHWIIGKKVEFLGLTLVANDSFGAYRGSTAGPQIEIPFAQEHLQIAQKAVETIRQKGYFGPVGIDAMVYDGGKLHPLVEINARQTMSQAVLLFQKRFFPERTLIFEFAPNGRDKNSLLPNKIINFDEKELKFNKQFYFR